MFHSFPFAEFYIFHMADISISRSYSLFPSPLSQSYFYIFFFKTSLFEANKCVRVRLNFHEQFHTNRFIKLGSKRNFEI